ncbi:small multi-drug export protein [Demequina globuliformis]|uniref:small multi-drug export protein n=1 Tax=Demequina globuliformis TaxID=676202 RepID=UPI000783D9D7|nr:small multi-drug export protein [Demequina globuliformis]
MDIFENLSDFVAGFESWQQVGALMLISAIPFVESYLGSFLGIVLGMNPVLAFAAAVIGNAVCTFGLIFAADRTRRAILAGRKAKDESEPSKRNQKIAGYLEKYGVPGVSLLGPLALPSQFTGPTMVALGAAAGRVYLWMGISIVAWGVLFAALGVWLVGATG